MSDARRHALLASFLVLGVVGCGGDSPTGPDGDDTNDTNVTNVAPVALASADELVCVGIAAVLDGAGSSDGDGDPLSHTWSIVSGPDGSAAALTGATTDEASLVADVAGEYLVELRVSDGTDEAADTVEVEAVSDQLEDIEADTTLTAACPIYYADEVITVDAALTIEAGVTLQWEGGQNRRLLVNDGGGSIIAIGTETDTIRFLSDPAAAGSWEGIEVHANSADNQLTYVEVAYGGRGGYHNIDVSGGAQLAITHSLIRDSGSHGLYVDGDGVVSGFEANTFRDNSLAPVSIAAEHMGALDGASTYADGNGDDRIEVRGGDIEAPQTWAKTDAPWYGMGNVILHDAITVEPGAAFVFEGDINRRIIIDTGGSLSAIGTAAEPITFFGDPEAAGTWEGIEVRSNSPDNVLTYVEIAHGGRGGYHNVDVSGGAQCTVTDSVIRDSGNWGIYVDNDGQLTQSDNTFSNNASGDVRLPS